MNYSSYIKSFREKNKLSQDNFAKKIGVSVQTVNRWENEHFTPTKRIKRKLISLFKEEKMFKDGKYESK